MTNEELTVTSKKESFIGNVQSHISALQSESKIHADALKALENLDFPTTRVEDWKYTRTARIANEQWHVANNNATLDITPYLIPNLDATVLVFVNGFYNEALSSKTEEGIVMNLNQASNQSFEYKHIFTALNVAYSTAAVNLRLGKNVVAEKPIHFLHIITEEKTLAQASIFIHAEKSSSLQLVESFVSTVEGRAFSNRLLNIHVEENAHIHFDKIQLEGDNQFLLNDDNIHIEANGNFTINTLTIDGGWVRNGLNIIVDGENVEANLNGFYMPRGKQHVDNHTLVDHRKAHSNSNELYKGILNDQGTGVFNGKVYVQVDAQKTNAFQSNANVLLSNDAQMNTKPELEIYADDVKCSHGTTTGQMDDTALFYLKTRGIGDTNARKLLAAAFINDVVNKVKHEAIHQYVVNELVKRELLFV